MNAPTVALLQEIVRRESLSMLTYVGEAFPWTPPREADTLARVKQLVAEHNEVVTGLGRYLTSLRHPLTFLGSFPSSFTTINFLSLSYILGQLVVAERTGIAALERDLAALHDKDAHTRLEHLLHVKKKHLETLEFLAASHTTPAAS